MSSARKTTTGNELEGWTIYTGKKNNETADKPPEKTPKEFEDKTQENWNSNGNSSYNELENWTMSTGRNHQGNSASPWEMPLPKPLNMPVLIPEEEYRSEIYFESNVESVPIRQGNCPECGVGNLEVQTCTCVDILTTILCCLIFLPLGAICLHARCNTEYRCPNCKAKFEKN